MATRIHQDRSENSDESERLLADIRGLVWGTQKKTGSTWEAVAKDAGLSAGTVARLASGETRRPHMNTITALARSQGWRLALLPATSKQSPGEYRMSAKEKRELVARTISKK